MIRGGPWSILKEVERRGEQVLAVQLVSSTGEQERLTLHREPDGRLSGATVLRAAPCAELIDPASVKLVEPVAGPFQWFFDLIASDRDPTDDEMTSRLSPDFLAQLPPARFREALGQLRGLAPLTLRAFEGAPRPTALEARVGVVTGEEARVTLAVEADPPHRITGALLLTQQPCRLATS